MRTNIFYYIIAGFVLSIIIHTCSAVSSNKPTNKVYTEKSDTTTKEIQGSVFLTTRAEAEEEEEEPEPTNKFKEQQKVIMSPAGNTCFVLSAYYNLTYTVICNVNGENKTYEEVPEFLLTP